MPVGREPVGVLAGEEAAAAELEHLEDADLALGRPLAESDRIASATANSGATGDLVAVVLADPERGRPGTRRAGRRVVEEASESSASSRRTDCSALKLSIDDHPGLSLLEERVDPIERLPARPSSFSDLAEILVEHRGADRGRDRRSPASGRSAGSSRAARRPSRGRAPGRSGVALWNTYCWARIVLPDPGSPMIRLMPLRGQTAAEHGVESLAPLDTRSRHRRRAPRFAGTRSCPSRSLTVETSCSGSSGFCRNASAPVCPEPRRAIPAARSRGRAPPFPEGSAETRPRTARDQEVDHGELTAIAPREVLRVAGIERHDVS